jgi:hypothetical protein
MRGPSRISRPAPAGLISREIEVGQLDEAEDRLRMLEQHLTGLREGHGAPSFRPLDEAVADPALEQRDLLADRRLREPESAGGRPERTLACDRAQRRQVT